MSILLITRNFPPLIGGMERLNQHLLQELEQEYTIHLIGPSGATQHVSHPEQVVTCPATPVHTFLINAALQGVRLARHHRPRLIIAGSGVNAPPAWLTAQVSGAPWIVYLHGLDLVVDHFGYRRIFLPIIRRADAWFVNSHATAQLAVAAGLDANRLHILHPGVDLPEIVPSDERVRAWREQQGLGDAPLMLSVGRLTRRKGLREFILHALPAILATHPNALLAVVGEEPHSALTSVAVGLEALWEAARQTGTQESLRMLGKLSDEELGLAYRAASVLVFPVLDIPGDMEGFGMVAIEAAAHGLPTVAFAVGGVPDAISDGYSGHLIPPGDYPGMVKRVIEQLSGKSDANDVAACRAFAAGFAWPKFGIRLRQFCQELITRSGALRRTQP